MEGKKFDADFELLKLLGKGGFARVYEAQNRVSRERLAVKVYFKSALDHLVRNEIQSLKRLDHPKIVKLICYYDHPKNIYLCMEKVCGGELFDRLTNKKRPHPYTEATARDVCRSLVSVIKHCHANDVVHRDIKPDNIMMVSLADESDIKVVDFGLAVITTGFIHGTVGTPLYRAPEMWNNNVYGKPVDMWAIGVVSYILLGGRPPFTGDRQGLLCAHITQGDLSINRTAANWKHVSADAHDFVARLLDINASTRITASDAEEHPWVTTQAFLSFNFVVFVPLILKL